MKLLFCVFLVALAKHSSAAVVAFNSHVIVLTDDNFAENVLQSDEIWVVDFYAPWCKHSKKLVPEYSKAATALKGVAKLAAIDADKYRSHADQYEVEGYPTVFIFADKTQPYEFTGEKAVDLIDEVNKFVKMKTVTVTPTVLSKNDSVENSTNST